MATCYRCGNSFSVSSARRIIDREFGSGTYDDDYPDHDVCDDCAWSELQGYADDGQDTIDLMGPGWDPD